MSESTALTIMAISTAVLAVCTVAAMIVMVRMALVMNELAGRVKELTEEIRSSTMSTLTDVRSSVQALGQAASVARRVAQPLVAVSAFRGVPNWVRRVGLVAGLAAVGRQAFVSFSRARQSKAERDASVELN